MGTQVAKGRFGRVGTLGCRAASIAEPAFWHKKELSASFFEPAAEYASGLMVIFHKPNLAFRSGWAMST